VLRSEIEVLGARMITKIFKKYSVQDNEGDLIELNALVDLLALFKYACNRRDKDELL
jgi:hypothetical protein